MGHKPLAVLNWPKLLLRVMKKSLHKFVRNSNKAVPFMVYIMVWYLAGDAYQIEGMVSLVRRMLGVSAHLGNPPLQVYADEQHQAALRRSQYATASGLLHL